MVSQVDVKNRLESVVLVVFRFRVSVGRIIPGVKARKIGSGFYCFDVSSVVSSLNPWPPIGSTMDVHRTVTSQGSNLCWSGPEFTQCIRFTEA